MIRLRLLNRLLKALRLHRLYQIINCVHLVAIQCILRIGSGKDYQCPFGNGTGKLNSRNAGHLNIQKDKVYYVLLHKVGSRGGTVKTSHQLKTFRLLYQQFHSLPCQWFIVYNNTIHNVIHKVTIYRFSFSICFNS